MKAHNNNKIILKNYTSCGEILHDNLQLLGEVVWLLLAPLFPHLHDLCDQGRVCLGIKRRQKGDLPFGRLVQRIQPSSLVFIRRADHRVGPSNVQPDDLKCVEMQAVERWILFVFKIEVCLAVNSRWLFFCSPFVLIWLPEIWCITSTWSSSILSTIAYLTILSPISLLHLSNNFSNRKMWNLDSLQGESRGRFAFVHSRERAEVSLTEIERQKRQRIGSGFEPCQPKSGPQKTTEVPAERDPSPAEKREGFSLLQCAGEAERGMLTSSPEMRSWRVTVVSKSLTTFLITFIFWTWDLTRSMTDDKFAKSACFSGVLDLSS